MIRREDFIDAIGMPDEGFAGTVDAALRQVKEREARPVMKRKMTLTMLAAVIAVIALTGAALAIGLNLFDYFGRYDERLKAVAPESAVEDAAVAEVTTGALGVTRAKIDSAYYDGESLIAAYSVDRYSGFEPFEPTEAELAQMTEDADFSREEWEPAINHKEAAEALKKAIHQKTPFGFAEYEIAVGDPCTTDGGVKLTPNSEAVESVEDGPLYCLFEFETPLPEAARNRDRLNLTLPLNLYTSWYWFDGEKMYVRHTTEPLAELTATVSRADQWLVVGG